jgi:hypothetical protein
MAIRLDKDYVLCAKIAYIYYMQWHGSPVSACHIERRGVVQIRAGHLPSVSRDSPSPRGATTEDRSPRHCG